MAAKSHLLELLGLLAVLALAALLRRVEHRRGNALERHDAHLRAAAARRELRHELRKLRMSPFAATGIDPKATRFEV